MLVAGRVERLRGLLGAENRSEGRSRGLFRTPSPESRAQAGPGGDAVCRRVGCGGNNGSHHPGGSSRDVDPPEPPSAGAVRDARAPCAKGAGGSFRSVFPWIDAKASRAAEMSVSDVSRESFPRRRRRETTVRKARTPSSVWRSQGIGPPFRFLGVSFTLSRLASRSV